MTFPIADTFTDSLARLTGDEQKAVKTTAFDFQINPVNPGMALHRIDNAKDKNFWSARVSRDIRLGIRAIRRAGAPAPRYFRAPHGFRSPWTTPIASSYGERTVGWSLGVWDSDRPGVDEIVKRTLEGVSPGSIVLLHDGDGYNPDGDRTQTAAALPQIIDRLKEQGYEFATLPTE